LRKPQKTDTIAAIATPPGRGGVGIVRVSGPDAADIARDIIGKTPAPRQAVYCQFKDHKNQIIDTGIALYFLAPHSFTGENVLELQGHGGPVVMDLLLKRCLQLGARLARPGEFSERAFLNDKLDLAQAEAIADLIDSGSEQAVRSAQRSLQGEFSEAINQLLKEIIELRVYVEAALDFPEEEIDFLADSAVTDRLEKIKQKLNHVFQRAQQGRLLREGMHLVIAGRPNAGKSSLMNALAGAETAIVTDIAGTTRDVLRESINLDGMPLHIVDTAGLRHSDDPIEQIGIQRAWEEIKKADLVLLLIDATVGFEKEEQAILDELPASLDVLRVHNKTDLCKTEKTPGEIYISAKTGEGIDTLRKTLEQRMGYQSENEDSFIARRRHLDALQRTKNAIENAATQKQNGAGELMAEELRQAQEALGEITGKFTSDDLLGEIFSSFCIGK